LQATADQLEKEVARAKEEAEAHHREVERLREQARKQADVL
jgi:hypothetical protein